MSACWRRQRLFLGIIFLMLVVGTLVLALIQLDSQVPEPLTLAEPFVCMWLVMMVFNMVDLLLLDWLIFMRLHPGFILLPGTEGMAE